MAGIASDLRPDLRSDLLPIGFIFGAGLLAAWVCFGLLESQANVDTPYSIGGAFAGAFISWSALGALFLRIRRSSAEFGRLHDENNMLRDKLLRGAPRPSGFSIEVDERAHVVLARPSEWEPNGGLIFGFQCPRRASAEDLYPARFLVYATPIAKSERKDQRTGDRQRQFYDEFLDNLQKSHNTAAYATELVYVDGVPSLRFTQRTYVQIRKTLHPTTGEELFEEQWVNQEEFARHIRRTVDEALAKLGVDLDELLAPGESQARGLERMEYRARKREQIATDYETALERGHRKPSDRLLTDVLAFLEERFGIEMTARTSTAPVFGLEGAARGAKPDESPAAVEGVRSVELDRSATEREFLEILPVGRMGIASHHSDLDRVFVFEFSDNSADYVKSSETFSQIMSSVRFLG